MIKFTLTLYDKVAIKPLSSSEVQMFSDGSVARFRYKRES